MSAPSNVLASRVQVAHRARNLAETESARDALTVAGIAAHVSDQVVADMIRAMLDNRTLDPARRASATWFNQPVGQ